MTIRDCWYRHQVRLSLLAHEPSCWFCGRTLTEATSTIDHLIPRAAGGRDLPTNYRLCCEDCNQSKADRLLHELVCRLPRGAGLLPLNSEAAG